MASCTGPRRGADIAVVEVDDIAVDAERGADLAPEILIGGDLFRGAGSGGAGGGTHAVDGMALQYDRSGEAQQMTAVHWKLTIAWQAAQRKKCRRRKRETAAGLKGRSAVRLEMVQHYPERRFLFEWSRGAFAARIFTAGEVTACGAPGRAALRFGSTPS